MSIYRKSPKDFVIDEFINTVSNLSDHNIFQSQWSFNKMKKLFNYKELGNFTIIKNSYKKKFKRKIKPSKKLKILISSWSDNWIKGFEIYQYIDSSLEKFDNFEVYFIGRMPIRFKNIKYLGVMSNNELMEEYLHYDIFLNFFDNYF